MSCTRSLSLAVAIATIWFSVLILTVTPGQAASVQLSWNAPTTNADGTPVTDLAGYKVYYGLASRNYGTPIDVGNTTPYTLSGLTSGLLYYIAVKAYDTSRNESAFSSEVSFVPPIVSSLVANFTAAPTIGSAPLAVVFTDTSTGSLQSWNWTFGDGGTSTTRNPTHTYQTPGTYTVSLRVTSVTGSTNTMTKTGYVTILRTGLVGAYGFNEGSGTRVNDLSGKGNHGTISGASWTSSGRYGKALSFDGNNDWVTINDAASLDLSSGMTLEAWVYPTVTPSGWKTLIMKENSGGAVYYLDANSDQNRPVVGGLFSSGTQKLYGGSRLANNTWTHLAATYNGSTQRIYVNGVQVAQRSQTGSMQTSSGVLRIGGNGVAGWGYFFRGRIDEVRIYNRALTALEIQADKNLPLPIPLLGTGALLAGISEQASALEADQAGVTSGLASVRPEAQRSTDRISTGSHSQVLTTSSEPLTSAHLDVGEVDVDQSWKRVTLRQPFVDPVVIAKSLSSREAEPAVVRVRHVEPTGFEISLQPWDESSRPLVAETVGYLVIERGHFDLGDGTFVETGTVDVDPSYPVHSIAFSQPFRAAPVVMTTLTTVEDAMAVTSQPAHVSRQGMQLQLQSQGLSSHHDALQTVSYIAWATSTGAIDGLVFEVGTTRAVSREQFQTIPYHQSFATAPVFVADIQSSRGGSPINVRWDQKALEGIDVKIDDAPEIDAEEDTTQHSDVVGYILIQSPPSP